MLKRPRVVQGQKIALCDMQASDQPFFLQWLTEQPELRAAIDDEHIPTLEDQEHWFQRSQQSDRKMFSLVTIEDGRLIGNAGFVDIDSTEKSAQFRITIGHSDARGKGYGREVLALLLQYGFETMKLQRVWLRVRKDNIPARSLYEQVGFRTKEEYPAEGQHGAGLIMEIDATMVRRI